MLGEHAADLGPDIWHKPGRADGGERGPVVERIVSGGQTGADQGGLEAAGRLGLATGGFMPKGYRTEDGPRPDLAARHGLVEAETPAYPERTGRNVRLADGTVVFAAEGSPGSRLTVGLCRRHGRPCLELPRDLPAGAAAARLRSWLADNRVRTLNVAGSRESGAPGIGAHVARVLVLALGGAGGPAPDP